MAGFFHCPCLMVNGDFVAPLTSEDAILANMRGLVAHHREQGYGRAVVADLDVQLASESLAIVSVHWRVFDREDALLWDFRNTYNLVRYDSNWKVLVSTTHESAAE